MNRLVVKVPRSLKEAVRARAAAQNTTMSEVVNAAIEDYLNPNEYQKATLRHLTRIGRKLDISLQRDELALETLSRFLLVYLIHTPTLPPEMRAAATKEGLQRWESFVEKISHDLSTNRTYLAAVTDAHPTPDDFYYSNVGGDDEQ